MHNGRARLTVDHAPHQERDEKMLDFVILAFTVVLGLLIVLVFLYWSDRPKLKQQQQLQTSGKPIPRWTLKPADPKIGDLGEMSTHGSIHQYLLHLHKAGRCPVTSFWWNSTHVVSVCSPQAFKDTLKLTNRPSILFEGYKPLAGSASIQFANGDDWEARRKCLFPSLLGDNLKGYGPIFVEIGKEAVRRWAEVGEGGRIAAIKEAFAMTMPAICRCCLGDVFKDRAEVEALSESHHKCWREMELRIVHGPPDSSDTQREEDFQKSLGAMKSVVQRIVAARREGRDTTELPLIDALLQSGVPEKQIVDDALTFMNGGFHTSGYFLTWLWYYLAIHPDIQTRLAEEVGQCVGGDTGEHLMEYALKTTTYMRQVLDETLRVSTLAPWAGRVCEKDLMVDGYCIPADTPIIHALGVSLESETNWADVEKFDPDRFAPNGPHVKRGQEFCPFGVPSRRKCPGYQFSYFEVSTILTLLLRRFSLNIDGGQCVEPIYGLLTEPREEFYLTVEERTA